MTPNPDGPPDPSLDPERSPGRLDPTSQEVEVSRDDVTLGEGDPASFTAADTEPVADASEADLLDMLADDDVHVRRRAAVALGDRSVGDAAIAELAAAIESDSDAEVRQFAVEALGKIGRNRSASVLRAAMEDRNPWVRSEAVVALDRLDREANADCIEAALDDDHEAVRRNAAISLYRVRGAEMLPELLELLSDPSDRVREWVASFLGDVEDERADAALAEAARNDASDIVRATAARALDVSEEEVATVVEGSRETIDGADVLNRRPDV